MMPEIRYENEIWNYAYVDGGMGLSERGREKLVYGAIRLDKGNKHRRTIKGDGFEGCLTRDKFFVMGSISGQGYRAELETNKGKKKVSILVAKALEIGNN